MMHVDELKTLMKDCSRVLMLNKEAVDLELLQKLDAVVVELKKPEVVEAIRHLFGNLGVDLLVAAEKMVEIEKRILVKGDKDQSTTDQIIASLNNLQFRPLILMAIASAL
jgi:hypothetical protein